MAAMVIASRNKKASRHEQSVARRRRVVHMNDRIRSLGWVLVALCTCAWVSPALAGDGPSADELARRALRADVFAWKDAKTRVRMTLIKPDGKRQERAMEVVARVRDGLVQTVVRFSAPADVAGTAVLMREQQGGSAEQYIYLSGLKRTRRIAGREREGSFMGSDFTYADMERLDPKHTKNVRLPDEKVGDVPTYVLESTITAPDASYGKLVTWVRKSDFVALRTRFFDKKGKLLKTLYARKVRDIEGKPVVVDARMQSESGHATEIVVDAMERKDDLPDALFTPTALERQ
jgi:hypothetical protein